MLRIKLFLNFIWVVCAITLFQMLELEIFFTETSRVWISDPNWAEIKQNITTTVSRDNISVHAEIHYFIRNSYNDTLLKYEFLNLSFNNLSKIVYQEHCVLSYLASFENENRKIEIKIPLFSNPNSCHAVEALWDLLHSNFYYAISIAFLVLFVLSLWKPQECWYLIYFSNWLALSFVGLILLVIESFNHFIPLSLWAWVLSGIFFLLDN